LAMARWQRPLRCRRTIWGRMAADAVFFIPPLNHRPPRNAAISHRNTNYIFARLTGR
jgi:hypothetical protein